MMQPNRDEGLQRRPRVPRSALFWFSIAAFVVIFALLPWTIGRRGRQIGWRGGYPGPLNRLGLIAVGLGTAGWGWSLAAHNGPGETVAVSLVPEDIITAGPYRFSRDPMYVSEMATVIGWMLFFGSPGLLAGCVALAGGMRYAVGREEKTLASRFGDSWHEYAAKVPRWL